MSTERKTVMVSVRLSASLVARMDFVTRNTDGPVRRRSAALQTALETWLLDQEQSLEKLGVIPKKAR